MDLPLEWSATARADLLAIIAFIADSSPQAAQDLKDEIEAKVGSLATYPKRYARSLRHAGYRQLTVRANYLVFYRLLPNEKSPALVEVAAVVHARRQWPAK